MSEEMIRNIFPNIRPGFRITSPQTPTYNCIGWAANDSTHFWWPGPTAYWPKEHNSVPSVDVFEDAFANLGYQTKYDDEQLIVGIEKVAIYVDRNNLVTHMARQLESGRWTSKLGPNFDIEHEIPECLNGTHYGRFSHCLGRMRNSI